MGHSRGDRTTPDLLILTLRSGFADRCPADLTIPDTVTQVTGFYGCTNLERVIFSDSVTIIGNSTFGNCTSLQSVAIPSSVKTIEYGAFAGCTGMTGLTIPEGVVSIGSMATPYTLESLTIPTSVTSIGGYVLSGNLKDVYYAGTEAQWKTISIEEPSFPERFTIHYNSAGPQQSAQPETSVAYASPQNVLVDGKPVEFFAYALKDEKGNDTNYVKLRDVAQILNGSAAQFAVGWDGAISITTKTAYTPNGSELIQNFTGDQSYTTNSSPVKVNGVEAGLEAITLTDADGGGFTYFKLRDLGRVLGFNVGWSGEKGVYIETNRPYDAEG